MHVQRLQSNPPPASLPARNAGRFRVGFRPRPRVLAGVCLALGSISAAGGQTAQSWRALTNPTIPVSIDRKPKYDLTNVEKIVFGPSMGACADDIVHDLGIAFAENGVEIVDWRNIERAGGDQDFAFSGRVDSAAAAALGERLGPSSLLTVNVSRCDTERMRPTYKDKKGASDTTTIHRAETRAYLRVSVQVADLTDGRVFRATPLSYSDGLYEESEEGVPAHPFESDVLDVVREAAVTDIYRMFFPWTETKAFIFFENKKGQCDLKPAVRALKSGDVERAFELSTQNVELCMNERKAKSTVRSNAFYNAGVLYRVRGEFDAALEHLRKAAELKPGADLVKDAIAECEEARGDIVVDFGTLQIARPKADAKAEARRETVIGNADIVDMVAKKLPELVMVTKIKMSECDFNLSTEALAALSEAGVPEAVIVAMMEKQADGR